MRCYGNTGMAEESMMMRHLRRASKNFFVGSKPSKESTLHGIDDKMGEMIDDGYQSMQIGRQNC